VLLLIGLLTVIEIRSAVDGHRARDLPAGGHEHGISRSLSLSRPTVRRFARAASADELMDGATGKESKLDPFRPYLHQRWSGGVPDATALRAELRKRGFTGSVRTVRRYLAPFRQSAAGPGPAPAVPRNRLITRWLLSRPDHLKPEEQAQLEAKGRGHRQQDQDAQAPDVRTSWIPPAPHPRHPSPSVTTKLAAEPILMTVHIGSARGCPSRCS
jgi:hypothetical protein